MWNDYLSSSTTTTTKLIEATRKGIITPKLQRKEYEDSKLEKYEVINHSQLLFLRFFIFPKYLRWFVSDLEENLCSNNNISASDLAKCKALNSIPLVFAQIVLVKSLNFGSGKFCGDGHIAEARSS